MAIASYRMGPPIRPPIHHDNGFLEKFHMRPPSAQDRALYARWMTVLEAAEAAQGVPFVPHNDLPDALAAYRHFLYGKGTNRTFSYDRYVNGDPSGATTLQNAITDARLGAEELQVGNPSRLSFQMSGSAIACGSSDPDLSDLFPYPETENWQKAIGAHMLWLSALVSIESTAGRPRFVMLLTLHAEDRYNFNPNSTDIATGIPDSANGRFEVTGLAKQYMNYSKLTRHVRWVGYMSENVALSSAQRRQLRKPDDNRRLRNRF